jgi:UDP-N-acetyl-D-glucosamine dehydrogenase
LAKDVNDHMPDYVVRRLMIGLNRRGRAVKGSKILILGLAYKPNTSDERESPALTIAQRLLDLGAEVRAADPHVVEEHVDARVVRVSATESELSSADAVLLVTHHDTFDMDAVGRHAKYVFDTRHVVPPGESVEYL